MQFFRKAPLRPSRLGILAGAFNPITVAHTALAEAALAGAAGDSQDEVVLVLPRVFPHKPYVGASFSDRLAMLEEAVAGGPLGRARFSIAASEGGLFHEIAAECRAAYGPATRLDFLCGRDAAERVVHWDYQERGAIGRMLREFGLLVAARGGEFRAPPELCGAIRVLPVPAACRDVSASEVRRRIAAGEPWESMVPPAIRERARRIYGMRSDMGPGRTP